MEDKKMQPIALDNEAQKEELSKKLEAQKKEGNEPIIKRRIFLMGNEVTKGMRIRFKDARGKPVFKVTAVRPNGKITMVNKQHGRVVVFGKVRYE
jgi:hypothetical protein